MAEIPIHPVALVVIGLYLSWMNRQKVSASSIVGECLAVVLWLALFPLLKWGVVEYFGWEVVSFWVYCRFMMMLLVGRIVEWVRLYWGLLGW